MLLLVVGGTPPPSGKLFFPVEVFMRPVQRFGANKHRSAKSFRRNVSHTKSINVRPSPMRGGFRL